MQRANLLMVNGMLPMPLIIEWYTNYTRVDHKLI